MKFGFVKSLRFRLVVFAGLVMAAALLVTGIALATMFTSHLERRVGQELNTHISQLSGTLRFAEIGELSLSREPADPRFNKVFGGLYWQIANRETGEVLRSRSLWDDQLDLPNDALKPGEIHVHAVKGPSGEPLLAHEQLLVIDDRGTDQEIRITVAIERDELLLLEAGFIGDLVPALVLLGLVLLAGFAFQITSGLRPVDHLRKQVSEIRHAKRNRLSAQVPMEVLPLVEEVNALLAAKEHDMQRSRDRAADLAHGLKTPLTALASDIERLRQRDADDIADRLELISARMQRHVERELAQARHRHGGRIESVRLVPALENIITVLHQVSTGNRRQFDLELAPDFSLKMDPDDINEVFGNLAENASRHASSRILITGKETPEQTIVSVEDDGPGLTAKNREFVLQRGKRLDETNHGAGLGLAIVSDILRAYDGDLKFEDSAIGGLKVVVSLPKTTPGR